MSGLVIVDKAVYSNTDTLRLISLFLQNVVGKQVLVRNEPAKIEKDSSQIFGVVKFTNADFEKVVVRRTANWASSKGQSHVAGFTKGGHIFTSRCTRAFEDYLLWLRSKPDLSHIRGNVVFEMRSMPSAESNQRANFEFTPWDRPMLTLLISPKNVYSLPT